ncbi:MAG: class II glutamine amidotransferase, partial [Candidatus Eisenbacteria bacterium]|nr:class II glutamine amidotransferase [Candidatus Eisenbacteria bacterium]
MEKDRQRFAPSLRPASPPLARVPAPLSAGLSAVPLLLPAVVLLAGLAFALLPRPAAACRFWALIGSGYPSALAADHLRDGTVANLRDLGGGNRDGWGIGFFPTPDSSTPIRGPIVRRGGPPANHPGESEFREAVEELSAVRPAAVIAHVRAGSSGHWGIPNPHPFQHDGMLFAHNGTLPSDALYHLIQQEDPHYLERHPPDYVDGHIDSELYFLYLLESIERHRDLGRTGALRLAASELFSRFPGTRLNCVLTRGDTLFALRLDANDAWDPLCYMPAAGASSGTQGSPYWVVASQPLGSDEDDWDEIPERSLAIFVPGRPPSFLAIPDGGGRHGSGGDGDASASKAGSILPNPSSGDCLLYTSPSPRDS